MATTPSLRALQIPGPHMIVREFLGDAIVTELLAFAGVEEAAFLPTTIGHGAGVHVDWMVRRSLQLPHLGPFQDVLEPRLHAVFDRAVVELGLTLEMRLVAHGDGAFYKRHIDTMPELSDRTCRALSAVYYFHALPRGFCGGQLRLHSILPTERGGGSVDVDAERDTLLLFPSWLPHEVLPVLCPSGEFSRARFAINCWFRRRRSQ